MLDSFSDLEFDSVPQCPRDSFLEWVFWCRWKVLMWEVTFLQPEEGNALIVVIRPHLAWSSLLPLASLALSNATSPQLVISHQSYNIIT